VTRKDYIAIAAVLHTAVEVRNGWDSASTTAANDMLLLIERSLVKVFTLDNAAFDKARFHDAVWGGGGLTCLT